MPKVINVLPMLALPVPFLCHFPQAAGSEQLPWVTVSLPASLASTQTWHLSQSSLCPSEPALKSIGLLGRSTSRSTQKGLDWPHFLLKCSFFFPKVQIIHNHIGSDDWLSEHSLLGYLYRH